MKDIFRWIELPVLTHAINSFLVSFVNSQTFVNLTNRTDGLTLVQLVENLFLFIGSDILAVR